MQVDFLQLSVDDHVQLSRLQGNAQWNSPTTSFDGWFFSFLPTKGVKLCHSTGGHFCEDFEILVFANGKSFEIFVKMRTNKKFMDLRVQI